MKQAFFKNAKLLNDKFEILPLMYGSLGLEYITGENLDADDIDILIPKTFINERWEEFVNVLEKEGYLLIDAHEHTFEKEGIHYSYAQLEELEQFAGIRETEISVVCKADARFRVLSLEQYLKVYQASAKDGYRIQVREKKDYEKIRFIEGRMKSVSGN